MKVVLNQFDQDIDQILQLMARGDADKKLQAMTPLMTTLTVEICGEEEKKEAKSLHTKNIEK